MMLSRASRVRLSAIARYLVVLGVVLSMALNMTYPVFAAGGQTGNVSGTVIEDVSGIPIPNASVTIVSPTGTYKTTTNGKGFFSILGLNVDTYTISIEAKGFEPLLREGVTIIGDQDLSLGTIRMAKSSAPRLLGTVRARNVSSAFQPNQTVDSVTVAGDRIGQTLGKNASGGDERQLVQAVPGVTLDANNNIIIRGSLETEVGYQFDGVPYTEPFFSQNSSAGRFNGLGSLQVVEGAGDATQGNAGGGVINIVPKRGTYPPEGTFDAEIGGPNYNHQLNVDYGFATRDGRISDYFAYSGQRNVPYYGYANENAASIGEYYGVSNISNDDIVNNFVLKFGKDNNQSLQILYQNRDLQEWGDRGGIAGQNFYNTNDPGSYTAQASYNYLASVLGPTAGLAEYQKLIGIDPYTPTSGPQYTGSITAPEQIANFPVNLLKFEYTNSFGANFFDVKAYNSFQFNNSANNTSTYAGNTTPGVQEQGGQRTGVHADFTHQFGSRNTTTLDFSFENQHPIWNGYNSTVDIPNLLAETTGAPGSASDGIPLLAQFLTPVNGVCPVAGGCGLDQYFPNGIPRIPIGGINYHGSDFLNYGAAIRDQWSPTDKLKIDAGLRLDTETYKIAPNPVNAGLPFYSSDTSDVAPDLIGPQYNKPLVYEPRIAVAYRLTPNDSIRAAYGRSVIFLNAQTYGTPGSIYNYAPFTKVPAYDSAADPGCGFYNPTQCLNFAQEMFWLWDQNKDAPDLGGAKYEADSNYDLTYQHQFKNGIGLRLTPFVKNATNVPDFSVLSATINPVTGQLTSFVFTVNNNGVNKATGVELGVTLPDRPVGLSGFLSATYQNVFDRVTPLTSGEENLPFIFDTSVALGDTYRAGYLSPLTARLGLDYKTKVGLEVRPIINYIRGYPFSAGTTTASNGLCGIVANVPAVNFGCGTTFYPGFEGITSGFSFTGQNSTQYVDPAYPGNTFNPNIAVTRGTPNTSSAGGILSKPEAEADLDVEFHVGKDNRQTLGLLMTNITGNVYFGSVPIINPYWQPVSTGVGGPQTGKNALANPAYAGGIFAATGSAANPSLATYSNGPYVLVPNEPVIYTLYYQVKI
jgi:hypothetical protein